MLQWGASKMEQKKNSNYGNNVMTSMMVHHRAQDCSDGQCDGRRVHDRGYMIGGDGRANGHASALDVSEHR